MWFFFAVLTLWVATHFLSFISDTWVLPSMLEWGMWTYGLYLCGYAALTESFKMLHDRVGGIFGYSLLVMYYITQSATYMEFLPENAARPDFWPSIFLSINLAGPIVLTSLGCMQTTVQKAR